MSKPVLLARVNTNFLGPKQSHEYLEKIQHRFNKSMGDDYHIIAVPENFSEGTSDHNKAIKIEIHSVNGIAEETIVELQDHINKIIT